MRDGFLQFNFHNPTSFYILLSTFYKSGGGILGKISFFRAALCNFPEMTCYTL